MKALKWIGIGLGGVAVLAGVIVALVFTLTAGAAGAADEFLALVGRGRYEEAYRSTAPQFQAQTSLETFRATMQRYGVDKYQSASWSSREISGGRATLEGTIKTRDGGSVAVKAILVETGGQWKMYGLNLRAAGVTERADAAGPAAPDAAAAGRLATRTLLDFNDAVLRADFTAFHATLARAFREQYGPDRLKTIFKSFVDGKIDIRPIEKLDPVFTKGPILGDGGALQLAGYYATKPSQVRFDLSYVNEGGTWRLTSINVRVAPAP
jgi:hypothetical protein